jgi:formylglycine-generating enzyme required for sulfatase activity
MSRADAPSLLHSLPNSHTPRVASIFAVVATCVAAHAQPQLFTDPASGIEFSRISALSNAAYAGHDPFNVGVVGRGSVSYEYSIGRLEVTTAQWVEFYNAALARPDPLQIPQGTLFIRPTFWGAGVDPSYSGPGTRYRVNPANPDAGLIPAGGITWRVAAMYCNWLHNGKATTQAAFLSGAYDVSTFSASSFPAFTDQASRSPGARYWIPSWDEWLKAVHYDPMKQNSDGSLGGWWEGPLGSDLLPQYGPPPGFAGGNPLNQANSDFILTNRGERFIPLGSYPNAQTPWGLLDAAGATGEWTESLFMNASGQYRIALGSQYGNDAAGDEIYSPSGLSPNTVYSGFGLRISTSIPQPYTMIALLPGIWYAARRRRP